jgi:DNA polymerase III sliding clamp (beta) subunit (PCNA family)
VTHVIRRDLLKSLESVAPGLSKKEVIEQSSCFVFKGGQVITFNDEVACSTSCNLDVEGAVVADPLLSLLGKLQEDELEVDAVDGELVVKGKRRKAGIRLESEISLPVDGIETPEKWKKLPAEFLEAVGVVQNCVSQDQSQFVLTCVHLHPEQVEACDNFQLIRFPIKTGLTKPTLVRGTALSGIASMEVKEFSETENWLHFRGPSGVILSCRRYMDKYPDIGPLLECKGEKVKLPKGLDGVIDKAKVFSEGDGNVVVELRSGKTRITGRGVNGWYSEVMDTEYAGEDTRFAISPKLLLEITKQTEVMTVAEGRIKIDSGKFTFVVCTGEVEGE